MGVSVPVTPLGSDTAGMQERGVTLGCGDPPGKAPAHGVKHIPFLRLRWESWLLAPAAMLESLPQRASRGGFVKLCFAARLRGLWAPVNEACIALVCPGGLWHEGGGSGWG